MDSARTVKRCGTMKGGYRLQEVSNKSLEKQEPNTLKIITWISAYAAWILIFLIPVIGIILIILYLLKSRRTPGDVKTLH
jgi:hypothetical protein